MKQGLFCLGLLLSSVTFARRDITQDDSRRGRGLVPQIEACFASRRLPIVIGESVRGIDIVSIASLDSVVTVGELGG